MISTGESISFRNERSNLPCLQSGTSANLNEIYGCMTGDYNPDITLFAEGEFIPSEQSANRLVLQNERRFSNCYSSQTVTVEYNSEEPNLSRVLLLSFITCSENEGIGVFSDNVLTGLDAYLFARILNASELIWGYSYHNTLR